LEKKYNKEKFDKNDYQKCMGPWESGHINADGKVFPCLAINFGDVRNYKKTEDIYNSKVALEFKKLIKKEGTVNSCSRCGYLKLKSTHS
jgi:radical SAM protein with 4Fe4S-binding SPASM domain